MRNIILLFSLFFISAAAISQDHDPVLFSVGDDEVRVSEFKYIYEKNNADNADYSKTSIDEYLGLYKKFKLKVHKAREIGLDTVKSLQKELEGYRKQLANSYLKDKEIADRLVTEVIDRMQTDKKVSHIFVALDKKADRATQLAAEEKINDIHMKLVKNKGMGFADMAKTLSEDKASAKRGGQLGYYTAPLPDGFYEFENAMYATADGKFSEPFQSKMGLHILRVNESRPARGEMEIAHLLVRKEQKGATVPNTDKLIDSLYNLLQTGMSFEPLVSKFSDDNKTKTRGGYLGFFGVNQYERTFEDAAFALTEDNTYSKPVETKVGYHIIKRISKRDNSNVDRMKKRVEARIKNNDRFSIAQKKLIEDVKKEAGFKEDKKLITNFEKALDETFYSYKWKAPSFKEKGNLFTLGQKDFKLNDFAEWAKGNVRERLKFPKNTAFSEAANTMYDLFLEEKVMAYEESNLENKYPDFKALMREYREGILLFEITKNEVWDKASQDTVGLQNYFNQNRADYKWDERLELQKVTVESTNPNTLSDIYKTVKKKGYAKAMDKYKKDSELKVTEEVIIKDVQDEEVKDMKRQSGTVSEIFAKDNTKYFYNFSQVLPPSQKTLKEARGYVIADYQDHLEKEWVEGLRKAFPIKLDEKVLKSLIK